MSVTLPGAKIKRRVGNLIFKSATFTPTMRTLLRTCWTIVLLHVTLTVSRDQSKISIVELLYKIMVRKV